MQPSVASLLFDKEWHQWRIVYEDGESIGYVDGNEYSRVLNENMGDSIVNRSILKIGVQGVGRNFPLHGDIRYFRFNDEYFDFSEGEGDTIVSNFGTVMDIRGDVSWAVDTLGYTGIDTSHHCEIIPLTDTHLTKIGRASCRERVQEGVVGVGT